MRVSKILEEALVAASAAAAVLGPVEAFVGVPSTCSSSLVASTTCTRTVSDAATRTFTDVTCFRISDTATSSAKRMATDIDISLLLRRRTRRGQILAAGAPRADGLSTEDLEWMPEGMRNCIMFPPKTVEEVEEEERKAALAWKDDGRKGRVLVRRREVPLPERDPVSVCQLVLQSLKINDDPMLNYGAAVAIKHASSRNPMRKMTPKDLGAFLQNDPEMVMLIANSDCRPAERAKISPDGTRVLQKVELVGSRTMQDDGWVKYGGGMERVVDVQLVKEDGCWMIDAFSFQPAVEGALAG